MSFAEIKKAQPQVFEYLESALEKGRMPHAILFLGPERAYQRETTVWLANRLLGKEFSAHPDLKFFGPAEDSRTFKVEDVRKMMSEANFKPFQAASKVFVIEPAEAMNDISQNALLKTLEEPPAHTYFVLICHSAEKLIATVRSRMQTLHFKPVTGLEEEDDGLEKAKSELVERLTRGRGAKTPDLGGLTREEAARTLEYGINQLHEQLVARIGTGDEDMLIGRIETLAAYKEKINQSANIKLALSVMWDEL